MNITFEDAMERVDRFEELLEKNNISVPRDPSSGADMLSIWQILKFIRDRSLDRPEDERPLLNAGAAVFDLAAKVLAIANDPKFARLLPHLRMFADGAVHLNEPPADGIDSYNKLIELYWACLSMASGLDVEIDDPHSSKGNNPDVLTGPSGSQFGYAMKTIRAKSAQTIYERIVEGTQQIERSPARAGMIVLNLTARLDPADIWNEKFPFAGWEAPAALISFRMANLVGEVIKQIPRSELEATFSGRKAVPSIICVGFGTALCAHPETRVPVATCLKVIRLVEMLPGLREPFLGEIRQLNRAMQTTL